MINSIDVSTDKELEILEHISESLVRSERVRQRDLARIIGMSLGMTNAILKRLTVKGFLTIRKVNNRNIAYAITPAGVDEIARRSYRYVRRTVKNIVLYKEAIESFVVQIKQTGYRSLVLVGESDLAFIVEHLATKYGLGYVQVPLPARTGRAGSRRGDSAAQPGERFVLYSEIIDEAQGAEGDDSAHLRGILSGRR